MATSSPHWVLPSLAFWLLSLHLMAIPSKGSSWCVARSNISDSQLQTALDYACGSRADCSPIQVGGLCYLPNTLQAHASYVFNSLYQRKGMAPGSCDFAGTATVALTDPSYGSCVFPSSTSLRGNGKQGNINQDATDHFAAQQEATCQHLQQPLSTTTRLRPQQRRRRHRPVSGALVALLWDNLHPAPYPM